MLTALYIGLERRAKHIVWFLFPTFIIWYFKTKWNAYRKIAIVSHGGLGDIAVLVPALKRLSARFESICVVCDTEYFNAIKIIFQLPENVYSTPFPNQNRKKYSIDKSFANSLKQHGKMIKVGTYANDPIINYPNSFFMKLGINTRYADEKYDIDIGLVDSNLQNFFYEIGMKYIYVNLTTSEELVHFEKKLHGNLPYVSYDNSAKALGVSDFYNINKLNPSTIYQSIINNVIVCLRAEEVIISDAGLFNIVIKLKTCPVLTVVTRAHEHSHNNLLYKKIKFNGTVQSCSFN